MKGRTRWRGDCPPRLQTGAGPWSSIILAGGRVFLGGPHQICRPPLRLAARVGAEMGPPKAYGRCNPLLPLVAMSDTANARQGWT